MLLLTLQYTVSRQHKNYHMNESMGSLSAANVRSPSQVCDNQSASSTPDSNGKIREKQNKVKSPLKKRTSPSSPSNEKSSPSLEEGSKRKRLRVGDDLLEMVGTKQKTPVNPSQISKNKQGGVGYESYKDQDVLSGRGGKTNCHYGNRVYRDLIVSHLESYDNAPKAMKPIVARTIVQIIRDSGGRFLQKRKDGLYYDIGDNSAREKTSQALRHRTFEIRHKKKDPLEMKKKAAGFKDAKERPTVRNDMVLSSVALSILT